MTPGTPARCADDGPQMVTRTKAPRCQPSCAADSNGDSNSSDQRRPATAHNARTIPANLAYARPEKQTVAGHAAAAAMLATGTHLSQISHGLTGRYGTVASYPDTRQDADLRFWIVEH